MDNAATVEISTTESIYDEAYSSLPNFVWLAYGSTLIFVFILVALYAVYKLRDDRYPINCSCSNWTSLITDLQKIYIHGFVHMMDTVSDFAVVAQFYLLMDRELTDEDFNVDGLNMIGLFCGTLVALLSYRLFTAYHLFYVAGGSLVLFCIQFLDLGIYVAIYLAWQMNRKEPIFWQDHLSHVEALFESIPQIIIQSQFILRSGQYHQLSLDLYNDLVMASIIISFSSVVLRFVRSDYPFVHEDCRRVLLAGPDGKAKSPYISWRHLGLLLFRGTELAARLGCHILVWAVLGFIPLAVIIVLELTISQRFLYKTKSRRFLFWNIAIPIECIEPKKRKHIYFRCAENCILMTFVTLYSFIDIPCLQCPSLETRHAQINPDRVSSSIGYFYLFGGWVSALLMPVWWMVIVPRLYSERRITPESRREEIMSIPRMFYRRKKCIKPTLTPLHFAIHRKFTRQIQEMLETKESGATPLHSAVRGQNPQIVELLLKYGSDVTIIKRPSWYWKMLQPWKICDNSHNYRGKTALEIAQMKVDQRAAKYGETSNESKCARRILAALQGQENIVVDDKDDGRTQIVVDEDVGKGQETELALTSMADESCDKIVGHEEQVLGLADLGIEPNSPKMM